MVTSKIAKMKREVGVFQNNVKAGAGWKEAQVMERDAIINRIEEERNSAKETRHEIQNIKEQIIITEARTKEKEHLCDDIVVKLKSIEESIEASNEHFMETQKLLQNFDSKSEMLKLNLSQEREEHISFEMKHKCAVMKRQSVEEKIKETQNDIDRYSRKMKEIVRNRDKLSTELRKQKEKNKQLDVQNTERVCQIREIKKEIENLSADSIQLSKKKDIMSQKIVEAERDRVHLETERDELKIKMNKILHVEMNMKKRENETQKRQREALKREMDTLDRKKDLCEKNSNIILDLTLSSHTTLKSLQHDSSALVASAREYQQKIQTLKLLNEKDCDEKELASRKIQNALTRLSEEEERIQNIQLELTTTESLLKQKQNLCETLKNDCNARSKVLVMNHEQIEKARKEFNVVDRQMNQIKIDISHIEDDLVTEHFNHHHANEDRETLREEIGHIRGQIDEVDRILVGYKKEMVGLHQSIQHIDSECDKFVKDYGTIIGYRDSIGNILLTKNEDLEKIQEKIKIQQSMLHHSESDYQEQISMLTIITEKLKQLVNRKKTLEAESQVFDEHVLKCRYLESDVQREKSKSVALKEELGRPFNIHRWRTLELKNPQKFDKIQKIQKLQKHVIDTADAIAQKERSMREVESSYFQTKRFADRQPQITELSQQLTMYESALDEKQTQMKNIDIDLNLTKKEVEQLRKTLKILDTEREEMKLTWIDSITQQ